MQMNFYVSAKNMGETMNVVRSLDSLRVLGNKPTRIGSGGEGQDILVLSVEGNVGDMNTLYNQYLSLEHGRLAWRSQNAS